MKTILHHLLLFSLLIISETYAQGTLWTKVFGGSGDDGGQSMVLTSDGSIVIAGFKSPAAYQYKDVLLMKTDAAGNLFWSKIYNLGMNDLARSLKQTSDGGFIIAGMTEVNPQTFDPFLIKTDSEGNMQWYQQYDYGFGDDDRGHAVCQTSDGGYILVGQTWLMHGAFGNYDMYIVKTDMNGNVQWTKIYYRENEGGDVALAVQQLNDGGYIIGGFTQSSQWASYIIRTDASGNAVWSNIYPGAWQSECYDIQATPDGGFIYTGTESNYTTDTDVLLIKLNGDGILQWKKIYGSVDADQGEYLEQLQDGGYIISGMSAAGGSGYDMYIVRTNSTGDLLWSSLIGGSGDDRAFSVSTTQDGSHIVTGWSWSYGQGMGDVYLAKLEDSVVPVELTSFTADVNGSDVVLKWSTATETNNRGFEILKMLNGTWEMEGFMEGKGTTTEIQNYTYIDKNLLAGKYSYKLKQIDFDGTFEYSDVVEVEVNNIPSEFSLKQNFPNPFNPNTTINFSLQTDSKVVLKVYNIIGKEVATLVNNNLAAGLHSIDFNAASLNSGVFFYKIDASGSDGSRFTAVKKMILTK